MLSHNSVEIEEEGIIGSPAPLPFWNNSLYMCPIDSCLCTTPFVSTAIDHLSTAHAITICKLKQVLPFLDEYIYAMARKDAIAKLAKKEQIAQSNQESSAVNPIIAQENFWDSPEIRSQLQLVKLNHVLRIQQTERQRMNDPLFPVSYNFIQVQCLFCKSVQLPSAHLFTHLWDAHGLYLGNLNNLVNVDLFLQGIRDQQSKCVCLLCERVFTSVVVLRKHMRKRKHFKLNPKNEFYDRFYISNYSADAYHQGNQNDNDDSFDVDHDSFDDWDEVESEDVMCLFCSHVLDSRQSCFLHMKNVHNYNLKEKCIQLSSQHLRQGDLLLSQSHRQESGDLNETYVKIKLINHIRRSQLHSSCFVCKHSYKSQEELLAHLQAGCINKEPCEEWSVVGNLFPCFDSDTLLMIDFEDDGSEIGNRDEDDKLRGLEEGIVSYLNI